MMLRLRNWAFRAKGFNVLSSNRERMSPLGVLELRNNTLVRELGSSTEVKAPLTLKWRIGTFLQNQASHDLTRRQLFATYFQYKHAENMNAERLLRTLPAYRKTMFQTEESENGSTQISQVLVPKDSWRNSVREFLEAAASSQEAQLPITHPKNQEIVQNVLKDVKLFSDEELCQIIYHIRFFAPCPSAKDPGYAAIWKALDKECVGRYMTWSLDYCFVIADLWYGLNLARLSEFHWTLVKRLFRKCDKLSKEHYVRFMFCLNLNRGIPDNSSAYDLEYSLYKVGNQMTAEEVIVVGMALFKTQVRIRDPELLRKLLSISMKSSESLDSISVSVVAKLARFSGEMKSTQILMDLQEKFVPEIPRLSITACTHLALSATNTMSPCKQLIQLVAKRIQENISETRLKEIERISLAMTMFDADCEDLCNLIAEELRNPERADEIRKYGRCLPAVLHYLSMKNVFIPDLMSTCLSKEFLETYYGKGKEIYQRELLCLDVVADLEIPDYSGNRLSEKTFNLIMKRNMMRLKSSTKQTVPIYQTFLRGVTEIFEALFEDKDCFHVCAILPQHHIMSCVLCRNREGQFTKIPQYFSDMEPYQIKKLKEDPNLTYHALVLCGRNAYLSNTKELTGQSHLQLRQMRKLGYNTHLVYFYEWESLAEDKQRRNYIEQILQSTISRGKEVYSVNGNA